jgi:hypothetical protein
MGVGETSIFWAGLAENAASEDEQHGRKRDGEPVVPRVSVQTQSDWVLMFGFTAIMTIPFALVAWLMS